MSSFSTAFRSTHCGQRNFSFLRRILSINETPEELALLDEPARGLGREKRRGMLRTAHRRFAGATLVCVTHDVSDTLDFDRVVVIEQGCVIEQGPPAELQVRAGLRYAELLESERHVSAHGGAHRNWRRLSLERGRLREAQ